VLDTPGFDDIALSDSSILQDLATELAAIYNNQQHLAGLIYLHDITKKRMGRISFKVSVVVSSYAHIEVGRKTSKAHPQASQYLSYHKAAAPSRTPMDFILTVKTEPPALPKTRRLLEPSERHPSNNSLVPNPHHRLC
jgi:hypothetical protein